MLRLIRLILFLGLAAGSLSTLRSEAPEVLSGDYDWVQLKSGEWLKGEIKDLQDESFTFDSDILDDLEIDWEDVEQLQTSGVTTIGMNDGSTAIGRLKIDQTTVTVANQAGSKEIPREELRSIIPGGRKEIDFWDFKVNLGGVFRSGNVEQADASASIAIERRTPATRLRFNYDANHTNVSDVETANNSRITSSFDYYMTPRLFLQIPTLQYTRDPFQNIEYRINPGVGLGYDMFDRGSVEWDLSGGLGYQYTQFAESAPGEPINEDTATLFLGTKFDWEATDYLDVIYTHDLKVPLPATSDFISNINLELSIELTGRLDLDFNFIWDYVSQPTADSGGVIPEQSDFRSTISLGWEL